MLDADVSWIPFRDLYLMVGDMNRTPLDGLTPDIE